jgi:carbamate kinase
MRIVVALGGNALLRRGQPLDAATQEWNIDWAMHGLTKLAEGNELIITHGNGPQVGLLARQAESLDSVTPYPLDVLGAESEGMIGYMLEQALRNHLPGREIATLLTQVIVRHDDPAFGNPTKPIGGTYSQAEARRLAQEYGWSIAPDGDMWRRVVASPEPQSIVELNTIRLLVESGVIVTCVGGGGIPVTVDANKRLHGIEAVIDKDLATALLAVYLEADALLLLTDVEAIEQDYGTPDARPIRFATPAQARALDLPAGSMQPKALAAARFAERTGGIAAIASLHQAADALAGRAGTVISLKPMHDHHRAQPV